MVDLIIGKGQVDMAFGMYSASSKGIQIGTSKFDFAQGLSVKPSSLTFKSSDGTTTDLLAGGTGDVTSAGSNTFTGMNIFKGLQIICLDVIAFSTLLNDGMTTYRSSHSTQFPFILGSVQLI